jgi:hypothetical protein
MQSAGDKNPERSHNHRRYTRRQMGGSNRVCPSEQCPYNAPHKRESPSGLAYVSQIRVRDYIGLEYGQKAQGDLEGSQHVERDTMPTETTQAQKHNGSENLPGMTWAGSLQQSSDWILREIAGWFMLKRGTYNL